MSSRNEKQQPVWSLRKYQVDMVEKILQGFKSGHPFIALGATAMGKSLVIAEVANRLNTHVLVLCPSKEILQQNYAKMQSYGLDAAMYSASVGTKEIATVTLATIGSIYKKPDEFKHFKYILFDEVHSYNAKGRDTMYRKLFQAVGTRKVCGLTATPYRLDQRYFGSTYTGCIKMLNRMTRDSFFREIVCKVEMEDLIEQGYLTRPQYHTFETDLSTLVVNTTGRDYTEASLKKWGSQRLDQLMHIVEQLDEKHKRVLVFCTSVAQAEKGYRKLQERFNIKAGVVTGKTPKKQREALLKDFETGEIRWMFNVGCLTTGFDLPVLDAVVLLRPTFSVGLYTQMVGRSVRLDPDDPNKQAHIYDFTDTVKKFGRAEKIKVVKEDGFKDMLMGEYGRLDLKELFKFDTKSGKPIEIREKFDINKVNLLDLI